MGGWTVRVGFCGQGMFVVAGLRRLGDGGVIW